MPQAGEPLHGGTVFVVGMGEIGKASPSRERMYFRNAADAGAYCHRVVLSWVLFPAMVATGTDWIFANLFWMGVMIWRK